MIDRTAVSERAIVRGTVELRTGRTWYVNLGDAPIIAALVLVFAVAWVAHAADAPAPWRSGERRRRSGAGQLGGPQAEDLVSAREAP